MIHLGLVGYPLGHSLSPKLHTAALQSCALEGEYRLFPIPPDDGPLLEELLVHVRSGEIHGLNVTIPHKQQVIPYLDELTATARSIGAVNTIYVRGDQLIGDNTDAPGFLYDLKGLLTMETLVTADLNALVLGAGGSARAVVYALLNDEWKVKIAARRMEQAGQLVKSFSNDQLQTTDFPLANIELSNITLIVNTTPIGMAPNIEQSPWPENLPFPPHAAIYDLIYNPSNTKFVKEACLQGRPARTGLGMLIEQAALSFEMWTGHKPSREIMYHAVKQPAP